MGIGRFFEGVRRDILCDNLDKAGMAVGDHLHNCEKCRYSVNARKSPTGLGCQKHNIYVPANRVCSYFCR